MALCCRLFSFAFATLVLVVACTWVYIDRSHGGWRGASKWLLSLSAPSFRLFTNAPVFAASICDGVIVPSAEELRSDIPDGWDSTALARKRRSIDVTNSRGGEEVVLGFEAGKCIVGAHSRALPATLAWNRSACIQHCLDDDDCLGVLWGRVDANDGVRFQCFLSGAGDDDTIITYPPCEETWFGSCPTNVTYRALVDFAPNLQCWQRKLWKCFHLEHMTAAQAKKMLSLAKVSKQFGEETAAVLERMREQAAKATFELQHSPTGIRVVTISSWTCIALAAILIFRLLLSCVAERRIRNNTFVSSTGLHTLGHNPVSVTRDASQGYPLDENVFTNLWSQAPPAMQPIVAQKPIARFSSTTGTSGPHSPWVCSAPASTVFQQTSPGTMLAQEPAPSSPWVVQQISKSQQIPRSPVLSSSPLLTQGTPTPARGNTSPELRRSSSAVQQSVDVLPSAAASSSPQELSLVALLSHGDLKTLKSLNGFGPKTAATFIAKRPPSGFSCLQDLVTQGLVTPKVLEKLRSNA